MTCCAIERADLATSQSTPRPQYRKIYCVIMFEPRVGVPSYPALEREVLEFWDEREIFRKLREQTAGGPRWGRLDGPITANNRMGVYCDRNPIRWVLRGNASCPASLIRP